MRRMKRSLALVLALVMCLSTTVFAAEVENTKMTITGIDGTTVTFDTTYDEKINVTYESTSIQEGNFYLVMVVAGTEDETTGEVTYVPTQDTILYIDQTTGVAGSTEGTGKIVFGTETDNAIYPSSIRDSAILIYGVGVDGEANSLIAAIIDAKYVIGDVNGDGQINVGDATRMLRYIAGLIKAEELVTEAADVNGTGTINVGDATKLLRVIAGLTTFESEEG